MKGRAVNRKYFLLTWFCDLIRRKPQYIYIMLNKNQTSNKATVKDVKDVKTSKPVNETKIKVSAPKVLTPEEAKLAKLNEQRAQYAAFLAERAVREEELKIERESKKRVESVKQLGKEDFLRLQIYLAGENGIFVHQLLELGKGFTTWKDGERVTDAISAVTVNHNWNRKSELLQRGEEKTADNEWPIGYEVKQYASKVNPRKNDNKITVLPFLADNLRAHLEANGAVFATWGDGQLHAYNSHLDVEYFEPEAVKTDVPTETEPQA